MFEISRYLFPKILPPVSDGVRKKYFWKLLLFSLILPLLFQHLGLIESIPETITLSFVCVFWDSFGPWLILACFLTSSENLLIGLSILLEHSYLILKS